MKRPKQGLASDLKNVGRGLLMGGADIIPGVSGGTVALILGIYERLVTAISHVDSRLLYAVKNRHWGLAALHLDLRFLVTLGVGIMTGVVSLASLMHYLLEHQQTPTYAAFFGLILASSWLVGRMVKPWTLLAIVGMAIGAAVAFVLVGPQPEAAGPMASGGLKYPYLFVCGMVAICAMILPGISGAYILVLLGQYKYVTGLIKDLAHLQVSVDAILSLIVFCSGCLLGLLSFAKVLRWLLAKHEALTMALLCGFMIGSLRKLWPFKSIGDSEHDWTNVWPASFSEAWMPLAIGVGAFLFVVILERATHVAEHVPPLREKDHEPGE